MEDAAWNDKCDDAFDRMVEWEQPPSILYHYCSSGGFQRIIDSNVLTASHVRYMSDPLEVSYGRNLLVQQVEAMTRDWKGEDVQEFLQQIQFFSQTHSSMIAPAFAVCFSEDDNDMSQWDRYGGAGGGFSLGFSVDGLEKLGKPETASSYADRAILYRITYDETEQRKRLQQLLSKAIRLWKLAETFDAPLVKPRQAIVAHNLAYFLFTALTTFKHPGFKAEKEWRLIYSKGSSVLESHFDAEYRDTPRGLVPFVKLGMPNNEKLPLSRMICGPRASSMESRTLAMSFLRQRGYRAMVEEYQAVEGLLPKDTKPLVKVAKSSLAG